MYKWHTCRHRERERPTKIVKTYHPNGLCQLAAKKKTSAWKAETALSWRQKSAQRTTWEQLTMSLLQGPGMEHGHHWENLSFYPLKANVSNGNKPCLEDFSLINHVFCACVFAFLAVRRISWESTQRTCGPRWLCRAHFISLLHASGHAGGGGAASWWF